jgi:hypothetical protein
VRRQAHRNSQQTQEKPDDGSGNPWGKQTRSPSDAGSPDL